MWPLATQPAPADSSVVLNRKAARARGARRRTGIRDGGVGCVFYTQDPSRTVRSLQGNLRRRLRRSQGGEDAILNHEPVVAYGVAPPADTNGRVFAELHDQYIRRR